MIPNPATLKASQVVRLAQRLAAESAESETYDAAQRAAWDLAELIAEASDLAYANEIAVNRHAPETWAAEEALAEEVAFYHEHGQRHPSENAQPDTGGTTMYAITATMSRRTADGWQVTRQLPTFYLHRNVQGILSAQHAEEVAQDILRSGVTDDDVLFVVTAFAV